MSKVLIACEESQAVTIEMRRIGLEAYSCDVIDCSGGHPEWHIKEDVLKVINREHWDLMIAFPPCTHLAASGAVWWVQKRTDGRQQQGIDFFMTLTNAPIKRIAIENPVGIISTVWRKPDQIIQPYEFGDPYIKKTCLWLNNLPLLKSTKIIEPIASWSSGSSRGGKKKDGMRTKCKLQALYSDPKIRSKTFSGIARAMAEQWGIASETAQGGLL